MNSFPVGGNYIPIRLTEGKQAAGGVVNTPPRIDRVRLRIYLLPMTSSIKSVHIVGGGLAGSEAAWRLAHSGVPVVLHEMRPMRSLGRHEFKGIAEPQEIFAPR